MKNIPVRRMGVVIKICTLFPWILLCSFQLLVIVMFFIATGNDVHDLLRYERHDGKRNYWYFCCCNSYKTLHSIVKSLGERWLNIVPMFLSTLNLVSTH